MGTTKCGALCHGEHIQPRYGRDDEHHGDGDGDGRGCRCKCGGDRAHELTFPDDDGFSVMGFHDDFRELGMMSMLSRNSSNSLNEGLNLNSSFCKMNQSDSMEM